MVIPIQICLSDYTPLTDEEITTYWESLTKEQRIEEIRKLDMIEHSVPIIQGIQFAAVLDEDGNLYIFPVSAVSMVLVDFEYDITFPEYTIEGFQKPENKSGAIVLTPVFCFGLGVISTALSGSNQFYQYAISGSLGIAVGLIINYFWLK